MERPSKRADCQVSQSVAESVQGKIRCQLLQQRFPPEIISHTVWFYRRFCMSLAMSKIYRLSGM